MNFQNLRNTTKENDQPEDAALLLPMINPHMLPFPWFPSLKMPVKSNSYLLQIHFWGSAGEIRVGAIRRFLFFGSSIGIESEGVPESLF
jgi:hypothetical protein